MSRFSFTWSHRSIYAEDGRSVSYISSVFACFPPGFVYPQLRETEKGLDTILHHFQELLLNLEENWFSCQHREIITAVS
ncbi:hypothetical protein C5167_028122 [Papaver somniferum]|nr:hypothetical protein C5167_028122 [Papaver somniferum]